MQKIAHWLQSLFAFVQAARIFFTSKEAAEPPDPVGRSASLDPDYQCQLETFAKVVLCR